ncbi:hypothetical protein [Priestia megaterium]|uniref:hypothetical protein n=1 Tax=Priestia megaterium TaxID=1404 RepID=UPI00221F4E72|nr:hypothetical protein [Priestia megaterium]UYV50709.1 hypothetical protein OHU65_13975 [Priestia megaterium]
MNVKGILDRVFEKMKKENVIRIIQEKRPGWEPPKEFKNKNDYKETFMELERLIGKNDVEDFIELAVMTRMVGLPAYTYEAEKTDFLDESSENYVNLKEINDISFQRKYVISMEDYSDKEDSLSLSIRVKEYLEEWRRGIRDPLSLSAVYKVNCSLDKSNNVFTIHSGNHKVQEVIRDFITLNLNCPLKNYRITEHLNQSWQIGNASYKTALLLDFTLKRLQNRGIFPRFAEIKFNTKNKKQQNDGIRNITINGNNLLSSQLACEYISLGCDIVSFKVNMTYDDVDLSADFYLKGNDNDILKIVLLNTEDNVLKSRLIEIIQEEYIKMCNVGVSNLPETKELLNTIYDKFTKQSDKLLNNAIKNSTLRNVELIASILETFDSNNDKIVSVLVEFSQLNKTILDSIGYDHIDENIIKINEFVGISEDESDFEDEDHQDIASIGE